MGERQQPYLNGAYYGPSVPPPAKTYHRPGGGGPGCCCCGCLRCCGCCLLSIIFNIIITLAVIIGIVVLIFWLIFRPNIIKFRVTDASLTRFDLTTADKNLRYNLALNITIRNPNRRIGVYYDQIDARAYYDDRRFASVSLPKFYQGHKNTTVLGAAFAGQNLVDFGGDASKKLNEDKKSGVYRVDLKLRLRIRFKVGLLKSWRFRSNVKCDLKVPLNASNATSGSQFETTKCHLDL